MSDTPGPNDPEVEGEGEGEAEVDVEALRGQLQSMTEQNGQLRGRLDKLETMLLQAGMRNEQESAREVVQPVREADPNFDEMQPKDMVRFLLTEFDKRLQGVKQELSQNVADVKHETARDRLVSEIAATAEVHKDLFQYQPQIVEKMAGNPNLSVEEAYFLVTRNKSAAPPGKTEGEASASGRQPTGLVPRGSRVPAERLKVAPKNFSEAGAAAWKRLGLPAEG